MNNIKFIGVPFDYGVELNNGRPGAKDGPNAIGEELRKHGITKKYQLVVTMILVMVL